MEWLSDIMKYIRQPKLNDAKLCDVEEEIVCYNYYRMTAHDFNLWKLKHIKRVTKETFDTYTFGQILSNNDLNTITKYRLDAIEWLEAYVKQYKVIKPRKTLLGFVKLLANAW